MDWLTLNTTEAPSMDTHNHLPASLYEVG